MIKAVYNWTIKLSATRYALWALAIVAFAESSFFPIPPDILLIPLIIAKPKNAYLIAFIAMVASVFGGGLGYYIGLKLYETVGIIIINFYHAQQLFLDFQTQFNKYGAAAVLFAGVTPFPYKIITISSGIAGMPIYQFFIFSIIARGARFFIIAILLRLYGEPIRNFIERHLNLLFIVFMVLLVLGFLLIKVI
ncbi:MAG: VTT domain-containing protein [Paracoccaceae bacterium]|jgi:membrane protein YqaA with SNARE-associated domain|nr:VTT domain-containing protein [Paracoccaceae bacterium]